MRFVAIDLLLGGRSDQYTGCSNSMRVEQAWPVTALAPFYWPLPDCWVKSGPPPTGCPHSGFPGNFPMWWHDDKVIVDQRRLYSLEALPVLLPLSFT